MTPRPAACEGCPANSVARGFVPPTGPTDALLAFIGQGPGQDEATFSEPFIGQAGRKLGAWCVGAGIPREKCAINNVVLCQLPKNRKPKVAEAQHCWLHHVRPWLESLPNVRVVVAVGVPAMQVFLGSKAGASLAGTIHNIQLPWPKEAYAKPPRRSRKNKKADHLHLVQESNGDGQRDLPGVRGEAGAPSEAEHSGVRSGDRGSSAGGGVNPVDVDAVGGRTVTIVPVLHPAFIMRGQFAEEPAQIDYLRTAWRIATGQQSSEQPNVQEPPPNSIPLPDLDDLIDFRATTKQDDVLACDAEWPKGRLAGIGFCRLRDEHAIYVPILDGEKPYWSDSDWLRVLEFIDWGLSHPTVFHNGQAADLPVLSEYGFKVRNYADDTMIRHHTLYADQKKKLDILAIRYLGFPSWKWTRTVEEGDDK